MAKKAGIMFFIKAAWSVFKESFLLPARQDLHDICTESIFQTRSGKEEKVGNKKIRRNCERRFFAFCLCIGGHKQHYAFGIIQNMRNSNSKICTVLTIAGSDSIGGAGIQADLKTISAFGLYGMSVITAVTAQNTQGVQAAVPLAPEIVAAQLDSVFTDIMPDCVKIGMLANAEIAQTVAQKLGQYRPKLVVLDPVMISSSGEELLDQEGKEIMVNRLFPMVTVVTPNLPEAEELVKMSGSKDFAKHMETSRLLSEDLANRGSHDNSYFVRKAAPEDKSDRKKMAEAISLLFGNEMDKKHAILIKGGHQDGDEADDYLYWFRQFSGKDVHSIVAPQEIMTGRKVMEFVFPSPRIDNPNTHGTGCTLASAVACGLARGRTVETSVRDAKEYIIGAIRGGIPLGKGTGPLNHFWRGAGPI